MSDDIRVGLVGAGYIADWHAEAIAITKGAHVAAVVDTSLGAAQGLADRWGAKAFVSLEGLIAAQTCDVVHILTPPPSHRALAIEALSGGLHCLVEKPVALSAEETAEIEAAAARAGRIFAAGHNFMGVPGYRRLKTLRESGALGRITSAEINWHFPLAPLRSGPFNLWLLAETKNLLLELGPHLFGFAVDLFGPVEVEHLSLAKPVELPAGAGSRPQSWRILARAGDVDVTLNLSLVETTDDRSVTLRGTAGMARLDYANDVLTVEAENASDIIVNPLRRRLSALWQNAREGSVNGARQLSSLNRKSAYGLSFQGTAQALYDAIRSGAPMDPRFSGAAAVTVMRAIDDTLALLPKEKPRKKVKPNRAPKPTALVIGGTGFIGRALTRKLVEKGHDVRVLSRGKSGPFDDLPEQVQLQSARLSDPDDLARAMEGIATVYHLGKSMDKTWEGCLKNDVGVTMGIAKAAQKAGVSRFVYTGTIASYDMSDPSVTIREDTPFDSDMSDRNLYARSKAECEKQLIAYQNETGLPLVIARPGIVLGAGGPLQHWGIGRWHGAGAVRIWGPGRNILPFVLIDDVADVLVEMSTNDNAIGGSFNLVGAPMFTARDYFDAIHQRLGARINVASGNLHLFYAGDALKYGLKKYALRKGDLVRPSLRDWKSRAHFSSFDTTKTREALGWAPEPNPDAFLTRAIDEANLLGF